jgi:hypothetical protein
VARQHHDDQDPRRGARAPDPALTMKLMAKNHHLVLRSGAAGVSSRRTFQARYTAPAGACFETRGRASLLGMREAVSRLQLDQ